MINLALFSSVAEDAGKGRDTGEPVLPTRSQQDHGRRPQGQKLAQNGFNRVVG